MGKRIKDLTTYNRKLASGNAWMVLDNGTTVNKVDYSTMAGELVGEYAGTSVAGKTQSVKAALDSLQNDVETLRERVSDTESATTWQAVANALRLGQKPYAIGDTFSEPWTDIATATTYDNPWRVNHYETCETESGIQVPGMWLQNQYALPFGVQFSHNRAFLRCPNGLEAGTYYVVFGAAWGSKGATAGSEWNFTLTKDVEAGGALAGFYSLPDVATSTFKVYNYKADRKTVAETVNVESGADGTLLGTLNLNSRNGDLNSMQEAGYGWNNYKYSAMRQFLNSEAGVGEWWTPQDEWDIAPNELATKAGFLAGLPKGFIDAMVQTKIVTYQNTVNDGGTATTLYDKVTIPSLSQMYVANGTIDEGESHDYYKQLNGTETKYATGTSYIYPELINHDVATQAAVTVRLRSANRGYANAVYPVNASGCVYTSHASFAYRPAPLVFIG